MVVNSCQKNFCVFLFRLNTNDIKTKILKWENKDKHFFFVVSQQISRDHKVALEVITYVGCTLSLVGESLTVVAYCLLM